MQRTGDLEERLKELLREKVRERGKLELSFYEVIRPPAPALVVERDAAGDAEVVLGIPAGCTCIRWTFTSGLFGFLKEDRNADGPCLIQRPDGRIEAHIIECKRTVDQTKWREVTEQMRWSLSKLMALAGALGIRLDAVVLYTAYRFDKLSEQASPNPAFPKRLLGVPSAQSLAEIGYSEARRQQLGWMRDRVELRGFQGPFSHHKVKLDEGTGRGARGFETLP